MESTKLLKLINAHRAEIIEEMREDRLAAMHNQDWCYCVCITPDGLVYTHESPCWDRGLPPDLYYKTDEIIATFSGQDYDIRTWCYDSDDHIDYDKLEDTEAIDNEYIAMLEEECYLDLQGMLDEKIEEIKRDLEY